MLEISIAIAIAPVVGGLEGIDSRATGDFDFAYVGELHHRSSLPSIACATLYISTVAVHARFAQMDCRRKKRVSSRLPLAAAADDSQQNIFSVFTAPQYLVAGVLKGRF